MQYYTIFFLCCLLLLLKTISITEGKESETADLKSEVLCNQCSTCNSKTCPPSESFPHMATFDDTLIAGALQSDYVSMKDRGVYSVQNVTADGGVHSYYGWESTSGSVSGYHRFRNYMDKCSEGQSYLTVDKHGKVSLRALTSLKDLAEADWKSYSPPQNLNHREFRFWVSRSTNKCLTVLGDKGDQKRALSVADCKYDGSNPYQLFAFRFHYHKAFCCCGIHNQLV